MASVPIPLRDARFRTFFAGRLVSMLGDSMSTVALSLAVLGASNRPEDLGIVLSAQILPHLALLMVGGAIADRRSRRTVLIASSLGSALTQGAVAALLILGSYQLLLVAVLQLLNGAITAFASPALRGIVPEVTPPGHLQQANALLASTRNGARILGPTIAALVVQVWGGGWAVMLDALSFLLAAGFLLRVPLETRSTTAPGNLRADLRDGWATLRTLRWAAPMIASFAILNLVNVGPWNVLGASITSQSHGEAAWGTVLSVRAVGLLLTSALLYKFIFHRPLAAGRVAGILIGLPLTCLGLGAPLWVSLVAALLGGPAFTVADITWETTLQTKVPTEALSRVSAYSDLLSFAAIPVGQLAVGPLSAALGPTATAVWCGVALSVSAAAPLASRSVRAVTA